MRDLVKFFTTVLITTSVLLVSVTHSAIAQPDLELNFNKPTPPFPQVKFYTSLGEFTVELYPKEAPVTVANFLQYVDEGFYIGTIFHRVIPDFVVQGGGIDFEFKEKKTRPPIVNEANSGLKNYRGTLAMARKTNPDSADSQFYINLKKNGSLDYVKDKKPGYTVFGRIVEGMETITKIEKEPRGIYRSRPDAPNYPVIIEGVERLATK